MEMNLNRYILQKHYGMTISYMALASFHFCTGEDYYTMEVPVWEYEIKNILDDLSIKASAKASAKVEKVE